MLIRICEIDYAHIIILVTYNYITIFNLPVLLVLSLLFSKTILGRYDIEFFFNLRRYEKTEFTFHVFLPK